jgi:hypothetical protein
MESYNSFTIQVGIYDRQTTIINWKTLRHSDGSKSVMQFPTRRHAMQHVRKIKYHHHIRVIHPDGTKEVIQ